MAWIVVGIVVLGAVVVCFNVMATIALYRTKNLTTSQKLAQGVIAWLIPIIGARLVLHLLVEHDMAAIPQRWIPNETINFYVLTALGVPARELTKFAEQAIEQKIYDTVLHHFSDSATNADSGNSADSGGGDSGSAH